MARKSQTKDAQEIASANDDVTQAIVKETAIESHSAVYSNCGGMLKQAREKLGLSIHDVSTSLRLSDKQIEAIESDRFDLLPQPSIVRGFIRNYAKTVKIDSDPIIAAYNALIPDTAPQSFTVKSNTTTRSVIGENKVSFSPALFIGLVLLFGMIAGAFYYYTQHIKPSNTKPSSELTVNKEELNGDMTSNSASAEFALPAAERLPEAPAIIPTDSTTATSTTEIVLPSTNSSNPVAPIAQPNAVTTEVVPVAPVATPQLQPDTSISAEKPVDTPPVEIKPSESTNLDIGLNVNQKTLSFTASEETWINIVNSRGKQIYSKVLLAGQSESIQATPPLKLTVGNAKNTTLSLDGQNIDLASHARNKVARLTID